MLSSQGVAMATAMAAVSGTLIILSFCLQKSLAPHHRLTHLSPPSLRPCISFGRKTRKTKKKVQFAQDVVDHGGNVEEFRRQISTSCEKLDRNGGGRKRRRRERELPANRVALYNGILRDRLLQKSAYSH